MSRIKVQGNRLILIQTPGEQFDEMIKDKFIEFITEPGHLSLEDFLFRHWLVIHIPERKRTISKEVKEKCLQFLRDKRQEQFVESHAKEMKDLFKSIGYKNV